MLVKLYLTSVVVSFIALAAHILWSVDHDQSPGRLTFTLAGISLFLLTAGAIAMIWTAK